MKCLLPVSHPKSKPHHPPPNSILSPKKVEWGNAMTDPFKRGSQSTLPCPQQIILMEKLGEFVAWGATLV